VPSTPAIACPIEASPPIDHPLLLSQVNPATIHHAIQCNLGNLFFIHYTATNTFRPQWFLVQIDINASNHHPECIHHVTSGIYFVKFFAKHPTDEVLSDPDSRWWPEWHEYTLRHPSNELTYGPHVLFSPRAVPDPNKYIIRSDAINLSNHYLLGPMTFQPKPAKPSTLPLEAWTLLVDRCAGLVICPPSLSNRTRERSKRHGTPKLPLATSSTSAPKHTKPHTLTKDYAKRVKSLICSFIPKRTTTQPNPGSPNHAHPPHSDLNPP